MATVNCFVIMPFAPEFDDVYSLIKSSVETATSACAGKCFRLDESRPAGRITDRLLNELDSADLCIADLTGCSPNVMWEVGYAMALKKPTVIITQGMLEVLPFDLKDMQAICYDRAHMGATLDKQLKKSVIDTLQIQASHKRASKSIVPADKESAPLIGELLTQVNELKAIVGEAVKSWSYKSHASSMTSSVISELQIFEGHWLDTKSSSHIFARAIGNDLVAPYCWGANNKLMSVFHSWEKMDGYWFARFNWLNYNTRGFVFLRNESVDVLSGSWWYDDDVESMPHFPVQGDGNPIHLVRQSDSDFPVWAESFLKQVALNGLPTNVLNKIKGAGSEA